MIILVGTKRNFVDLIHFFFHLVLVLLIRKHVCWSLDTHFFAVVDFVPAKICLNVKKSPNLQGQRDFRSYLLTCTGFQV